jgi:hypothetical protein
MNADTTKKTGKKMSLMSPDIRGKGKDIKKRQSKLRLSALSNDLYDEDEEDEIG